MKVDYCMGPYTICEIVYQLEKGCDKINIYPINPKTVTKTIKQGIMVNKLTEEINWNHKKYSVNPK